jgi:LmbE family N-acetylglucosaminyl deacetylase
VAADRAVVLVIAAHPDDEVLGCGGTAARRAAAGDALHIGILGTGVTSRGGGQEAGEAVRMLQADAREVAGMLGAKSIVFGDFPDNRMDERPLLEVVKQVEEWIGEIGPDVVYTHHAGDLNVDHRVTSLAVLTATRPLPASAVRELYAFEVLSSTEWAFGQAGPAFRPNVFEDIAAMIDLKVRCLQRYSGEIRAFPHPRSGEALRAAARRWGSVAGLPYAEAFELIRSVRT